MSRFAASLALLVATTPALAAELIYQPTAPAYTVVQVDSEQNLLLVHGAVPGPNGALVLINKVKR